MAARHGVTALARPFRNLFGRPFRKGYIPRSTHLRNFKIGNRILSKRLHVRVKKKNDEFKAASEAGGETTSTERHQIDEDVGGGDGQSAGGGGGRGGDDGSADVEGTKTLVVHGYSIETTEEEIKAAFPIDRKPLYVYTGELTVATFPEEEHAHEALHSTRGINGFCVEFAQENDLKDLGRSLHARVPAHAQLRPIHVIWDWENCTIPAMFEVHDLYENVQKHLKSFNFYIARFDGYGDRKALNYAKFETLDNQGKIKLHHVDPSDDKHAADIEAKNALLQIVADRLPPSPSLVISGDRDFAKIILSMRKRNYEVYLAYNDKAQAVLRSAATKCFRYEDLFGINRQNLSKRKKQGGKARKARRLKRLRAEQEIKTEN